MSSDGDIGKETEEIRERNVWIIVLSVFAFLFVILLTVVFCYMYRRMILAERAKQKRKAHIRARAIEASARLREDDILSFGSRSSNGSDGSSRSFKEGHSKGSVHFSDADTVWDLEAPVRVYRKVREPMQYDADSVGSSYGGSYRAAWMTGSRRTFKDIAREYQEQATHRDGRVMVQPRKKSRRSRDSRSSGDESKRSDSRGRRSSKGIRPDAAGSNTQGKDHRGVKSDDGDAADDDEEEEEEDDDDNGDDEDSSDSSGCSDVTEKSQNVSKNSIYARRAPENLYNSRDKRRQKNPRSCLTFAKGQRNISRKLSYTHSRGQKNIIYFKQFNRNKRTKSTCRVSLPNDEWKVSQTLLYTKEQRQGDATSSSPHTGEHVGIQNKLLHTREERVISNSEQHSLQHESCPNNLSHISEEKDVSNSLFYPYETASNNCLCTKEIQSNCGNVMCVSVQGCEDDSQKVNGVVEDVSKT